VISLRRGGQDSMGYAAFAGGIAAALFQAGGAIS
jgi:hypothetical protein